MDWVVGIISGLITGTITCAVFYWLGGRDLKREAGDLRRLNIIIIRALVDARLARVNFDENGNPTSLAYVFPTPSGGVNLGGTATPTAHHNPPVGGAMSLGGSSLVGFTKGEKSAPPAE